MKKKTKNIQMQFFDRDGYSMSHFVTNNMGAITKK